MNVLGRLAANGGGGALFNGGAPGQTGLPSSSAAQGSGATAGTGSGMGSIDGANGSMTPRDSNSSGGGGGGAGRIRINTTSGHATITGVISPALTTPCATEGTFKH